MEEGRCAIMQGVEHLGQYVYEMTKAKMEDLKRGDTGGGANAGRVDLMGNGGGGAAEEEDERDREEDVLVPDHTLGADDGEEDVPEAMEQT